MAVAEPQSITYNAVAVPLARTGQGMNEGEFNSSDGSFKLQFRHSYNGRARHSSTLSRKALVASPMIPSQNITTIAKSSVTVDLPLQGVTIAEAEFLIKAHLAYLSASTYAIATKLVAGES